MTMARVFKLGDHINTDQIIPGRYYVTTDAAELGRHCLCELCPDPAADISQEKIIIAGENFGCGSSREHAPIALKAAGVRCVVAKSFARIFFRNAINIGLPILISGEAYGIFEDGDDAEVDTARGLVTGAAGKKMARCSPLPPFARRIVQEGGIVNLLKTGSFEKLMEGEGR